MSEKIMSGMSEKVGHVMETPTLKDPMLLCITTVYQSD